MKFFSLILVIGSATFIAAIGAISIMASHALLLALLPDFLGGFRELLAWVLSVVIIVGVQVGECRPIYLSYKHTQAMDLYHQGTHPGTPDLKNLRVQLNEELGLNRSKQIWVRLFSIGITIIDFIWSCILFPPFKVGNDPGRIWSALLQYGLGAVDWLHVGLILGNVALIPACYLVYLNEMAILTSGKRDKAPAPATPPPAKPAPAPVQSSAPAPAPAPVQSSAPEPKPSDAVPQPAYNPRYVDPQQTAYNSGVPANAN
jgi:hypothetical protein